MIQYVRGVYVIMQIKMIVVTNRLLIPRNNCYLISNVVIMGNLHNCCFRSLMMQMISDITECNLFINKYIDVR